jgi:D-sedoheptulose 7-phosphate isomerase
VDINQFTNYVSNLKIQLESIVVFESISNFAKCLRDAWSKNRQVFLCGNGGSAANALHITNDLLYGLSEISGNGIRAIALTSNISIITCLANDISYADIFSEQLSVLGQPGDLLIALSGSGNSPNIIKVIEKAKEIGIKTFAILGFSGGKCIDIVDVPIHFPIDDMQISEDLQLIIGHMAVQWLQDNPPE